MMKIQTYHWITFMLYLIGFVLIVFGAVNGREYLAIQILGWVIMIIANIYLLFSNVKRAKSKEESNK